MDQRLNEALEFTNYSIVYSDQKELLKQKFHSANIHYHNGGKFTITKELINYTNLLLTQTDNPNNVTVVVIDDADNPIQIADIKTFVDDIMNQYTQNCNEYYTALQQLKEKRDAEGLLWPQKV
jgi:hypothetical protein